MSMEGQSSEQPGDGFNAAAMHAMQQLGEMTLITLSQNVLWIVLSWQQQLP